MAQAGERRAGRPGQEGEREFVEAILRKDRKATAAFVARFADPVHSFVKWRLARSGQSVDDVVQEVFLEAWRGLPRYRGDGSLLSWILGIARHKVQDHYRVALRNAEFDESVEETQVELPRIEGDLLRRERGERVQAVLAELPEAYRAVLLWRYWEAQSAAVIAAAIGRSEKAVERLLARARAQFKARYEA
ncbi:MAG: RNA polymerase sigma factor [Acidobacteriota bacterium]